MMLELSTIRRSSSGAAVVKGVGIHHRHRNAAAGIFTLAEGIRHDAAAVRRRHGQCSSAGAGSGFRISCVGVGDHSCKANNMLWPDLITKYDLLVCPSKTTISRDEIHSYNRDRNNADGQTGRNKYGLITRNSQIFVSPSCSIKQRGYDVWQ